MKARKMFIYNLPLRSTDTPPLWTNWEMATGMKELIEKNDLAGTWLLRYDTMCDPCYIQLCQELNEKQELGIWLEITSSHAKAASVPYKGTAENWFWAAHALTMGYTQEERCRLIDVVMERFHKLFGRYPQVVSMWMIDSFSADYLKEKYGVKALGLCRNQYGIDGYTMWGGWPNLPFWSQRDYIWQPAAEPQQRGVLVYPLISEDLVADYGNEKGIWSTEVATLQLQQLPSETIESYHQKLAENCLAGKPIGLASFVAENSWNWELLKEGYAKQIAHLAQLNNTGQAQSVTVSQFADWYSECHSDLSPRQVLFQPSGWGSPFPQGACVQACTKHYRARLRTDYDGRGLYLTDLRIYDHGKKDPYWSTQAKQRFARWIIPFLLDSSRFGLSGQREEPVVDIAANKPMGFTLNTNNSSVKEEQLTISADNACRWETEELTALWRFEEEKIILTVQNKNKGSVYLQLLCNPQVLPMKVEFSERQLDLVKVAAESFKTKEFILANPSLEGGNAALKVVANQQLLCYWEAKKHLFSVQTEEPELEICLKPYIKEA